ncbi:SIMPL domain-containing protein [Candidatus Wolfebacteria bacterium]|nr:SIMPL domain-containing protein [Candidatus Wolfebacteria bacterium]
MENDISKSKNQAIIIFLGFLMLVIIYSLFFGPAKKYGDSLMPAKTINVSAEGKVTVSPDIAKLSFSVVSEGANSKLLAENNNKKMNAAIDFAKSQGIEEKDIKTTEYNLSPRYEYDEKTKKTFISGYTLTQTVLVKVRDLNKVAEVLGGLPALGINQISSISFDIDEPEKYLSEARNQAFDKAKEKAKAMAEKNGVKLGRVINFYEYQSTPYYQNVRALGMGGAEAVQPLPQIQPGSQEVTIQVSVTYEIK